MLFYTRFLKITEVRGGPGWRLVGLNYVTNLLCRMWASHITSLDFSFFSCKIMVLNEIMSKDSYKHGNFHAVIPTTCKSSLDSSNLMIALLIMIT